MPAALDMHRIAIVSRTRGIGARAPPSMPRGLPAAALRAVATVFVDSSHRWCRSEHVLAHQGVRLPRAGRCARHPAGHRAAGLWPAASCCCWSMLANSRARARCACAAARGPAGHALPRLRVLATSFGEALRAEGERACCGCRLLAVPDTEKLNLGAGCCSRPRSSCWWNARCAAGARAARGVTARCWRGSRARSTGIPLAIELVAARLGGAPIGDLARRPATIDDAPYSAGNGSVLPRHRTLAAALDWSNAPSCLMPRSSQLFPPPLGVPRPLRCRVGARHGRGRHGGRPGLRRADLAGQQAAGGFDNNEPFAPYRLFPTPRAATRPARAGGRRRGRGALRCWPCAVHARPDARSPPPKPRELATVREWMSPLCAPPRRRAQRARRPPRRRWATRRSPPRWRSSRRRCGSMLIADRGGTATACAPPSRPWSACPAPTPRPPPAARRARQMRCSTRWGLISRTWARPANARWPTALAARPACSSCRRAGACACGTWAAAITRRRCGMRHGSARSRRPPRDPVALNLSHRIAALAHHFHGDFALARENVEAAMRVGSGGLRAMRATTCSRSMRRSRPMPCSRARWDPGRRGARAAHGRQRGGPCGRQRQCAVAVLRAVRRLPGGAVGRPLRAGTQVIRMMLEETQRRGLVFWHRWAQCY